MSPHLSLLVVPRIDPDQLANGLLQTPPALPDLVAIVLPVEPAGAQAVIFTDRSGHPVELDLEPWAANLSTSGDGVGIARIGEEERHWCGFKGGHCSVRLGPEDERYLPVDEDGMPDIEVGPIEARNGIPAGWGLYRSAIDLGMKGLFSCRSGPVRMALLDMLAGMRPDARAYLMASPDARPGTRIPTPHLPQGLADLRW